MKRRNPYPGITKVTDRHGKTRWRFRMKGCVSCYIQGTYASKEFEASYQAALGNKPYAIPKSRATPGTFDWLIEQYLRSADYIALAKITKKNLLGEMRRFRAEHGHRTVADLKPKHVEALVLKKIATPAAANKLKKLISRLCRYAIRLELIQTNPAEGVKKMKENEDGYHTWTDAEIDRFIAHHGKESTAVMVLHLILYTGAARQTISFSWL